MPRKGDCRPLEDRLWEKVDKSGGPDACWPFLGCLVAGYGILYVGSLPNNNSRTAKAHRVAWFVEHGEWPKDKLLHTCDNPPCCNTKHHKEGSQADNIKDMEMKGRARRPGNFKALSHQKGPLHPRAIITSDNVKEIERLLLERSINQTEIGKLFNIDQTTVSKIKYKRHWSQRT